MTYRFMQNHVVVVGEMPRIMSITHSSFIGRPGFVQVDQWLHVYGTGCSVFVRTCD
jgi:hypothetical protein